MHVCLFAMRCNLKINHKLACSQLMTIRIFFSHTCIVRYHVTTILTGKHFIPRVSLVKSRKGPGFVYLLKNSSVSFLGHW